MDSLGLRLRLLTWTLELDFGIGLWTRTWTRIETNIEIKTHFKSALYLNNRFLFESLWFKADVAKKYDNQNFGLVWKLVPS